MSEHEEVVIVKRMGGHAVAAVAGVHPHLRPIEVYARMVEDVEHEQTDAMRWGSMIEPMLLQWAATELQRELHPGSKLLSVDHEFLRSHPDARIPADRALVSAKSVGRHRARAWGPHETDHIPDYANMQEQLYLGIEGYDVSHVVASIGGDPPKLWAVPASSKVFELAVSIADGFMRNHVIPRRPPAPDGSAKYTAWIKEAFAKTKPQLVKVGTEDELYQVVRAYQAQRQQMKEIEEAAEKNEQAIKLAIGGFAGMELVDTGEAINWNETKRKGKDGKPIRQFTVPASWRSVKEE